jgi:hypothetical protein
LFFFVAIYLRDNVLPSSMVSLDSGWARYVTVLYLS